MQLISGGSLWTNQLLSLSRHAEIKTEEEERHVRRAPCEVPLIFHARRVTRNNRRLRIDIRLSAYICVCIHMAVYVSMYLCGDRRERELGVLHRCGEMPLLELLTRRLPRQVNLLLRCTYTSISRSVVDEWTTCIFSGCQGEEGGKEKEVGREEG